MFEVELEEATEENGTLRILRPDGVEVTADAIKSASDLLQNRRFRKIRSRYDLQ